MYKLTSPKFVVIHHSVTDSFYQTGLNIVKNQQKKYGKDSVRDAYHYMVTGDGYIIPWIPENVVSGHCGLDGNNNWTIPCNFNSLAVCFLGDFEKKEIPEKQFELGLVLIKTLVKKYYIIDIVGHRDIIATECPGKNLYKLIPEIKKEVFMDWKEDVINWALQKGLITSQDWLKNKDKPITIAELLAIIKNLTDKLKIEIGG
ncbi:MAG: N-acetylmuramoyl-L-alanine amidase [Ignavibacteria bacterium]|nr:N-acetylmuramoyl-L-alanine amidase [Ignavibacteria bacterium]